MLPAPGEELDLGRWVADRDYTDDYLSSVRDSSTIYHELEVIPPMALAARAVGALLDKLSLPAGTIHASQELECKRMAKQGEEVSCVVVLSRPLQRGDWRFVSVDFTLKDAELDTVMTCKSTVLVPGTDAESNGD